MASMEDVDMRPDSFPSNLHMGELGKGEASMSSINSTPAPLLAPVGGPVAHGSSLSRAPDQSNTDGDSDMEI